MKRIIFATSISIMLAGCASDDDMGGTKITNDFENYVDWGFSNPQLRKADSHSGNHCIQLDSAWQYSLTFNSLISDLPIKDFTQIKVSAWLKFPSLTSKARVVAVIDSGGTQFDWNGLNSEDFVTNANQWTEMEGTFNVSHTHPSNKLMVYIWNNGSEPIYADDLSFELK